MFESVNISHFVVGFGAIVASHTVKAGFDWLGARLWKKVVVITAEEHKDFEAWKALQKPGVS